MKIKKLILNFTLILLSSCGISWSQVTIEDYRKADELAKFTSDKVYYGNVRPSWIDNTNFSDICRQIIFR